MTKNPPIEQAYTSRLHPIIFLKPLFLLLIPLIMTYLGLVQYMAILAFVLVSIIWLGMEMIRYAFTWISIKPYHVILQSGFWVQQTIDLPLKKIESVDIRQTLIGTIFNYGDILITGSGGSRQMLHCIRSPLTCRRYIEQYLHANHD